MQMGMTALMYAAVCDARLKAELLLQKKADYAKKRDKVIIRRCIYSSCMCLNVCYCLWTLQLGQSALLHAASREMVKLLKICRQ